MNVKKKRGWELPEKAASPKAFTWIAVVSWPGSALAARS
jgi:hypothetical protein